MALVKDIDRPSIANSHISVQEQDLRHTFGSLLIQAGISPAYVQKQMGHRSIQVTIDVYGHLIPGENVAWIDTLDSTPKKVTATDAHQAHTQSRELEKGFSDTAETAEAEEVVLAAPQGFEPRYADPESAVLPLNEGAECVDSLKGYHKFYFSGHVMRLLPKWSDPRAPNPNLFYRAAFKRQGSQSALIKISSFKMHKESRNLFRWQPYIPVKGRDGTSASEIVLSLVTLFSRTK